MTNEVMLFQRDREAAGKLFPLDTTTRNAEVGAALIGMRFERRRIRDLIDDVLDNYSDVSLETLREIRAAVLTGTQGTAP